jgi:putative mRNA 3-end processing factor
VTIGGATITFHPAGHVLGSAQIAVRHRGMTGVVTGDYKTRPDPTSAPWEPVPCDLLVTEATFGLPVFRHPPAADEIARLLASLAQFPERTHLVGVYALGKAQRVARALRDAGHDAPIFIHGALRRLCDYYESRGIALGDLPNATLERGAPATSPAPSCSGRPRPSARPGSAASPTRSSPSPRAGCGCAPASASAAPSSPSSSPTIATGTSSPP